MTAPPLPCVPLDPLVPFPIERGQLFARRPDCRLHRCGLCRFCISSAVRMPSRSQFCSSVRKYPAGLRGAFSAVCRAVSKNTSRCIPLFCSLRSSRQKLWSNLQFSFSSSSGRQTRISRNCFLFSGLLCSTVLYCSLLFCSLLFSALWIFGTINRIFRTINRFPCGK